MNTHIDDFRLIIILLYLCVYFALYFFSKYREDSFNYETRSSQYRFKKNNLLLESIKSIFIFFAKNLHVIPTAIFLLYYFDIKDNDYIFTLSYVYISTVFIIKSINRLISWGFETNNLGKFKVIDDFRNQVLNFFGMLFSISYIFIIYIRESDDMISIVLILTLIGVLVLLFSIIFLFKFPSYFKTSPLMIFLYICAVEILPFIVVSSYCMKMLTVY